MKSITTIKSVLGLSQEEAAMLLGVTRTQWSMFEIGQRDLPPTTLKKLATILAHLNNLKETSKERQKITILEQQKTQEWLKQEWNNLEYKKQVLDRKILTMEHKRAGCFAALEVVQFLETQQPEDFNAALLKMIQSRATTTLNKNALHHLQEMQLKKESLDILKDSLEQKMKQNLSPL